MLAESEAESSAEFALTVLCETEVACVGVGLDVDAEVVGGGAVVVVVVTTAVVVVVVVGAVVVVTGAVVVVAGGAVTVYSRPAELPRLPLKSMG